MGGADHLNYLFDDVYTSFRPTENSTSVSHHRVVIEMPKETLVSFSTGVEIEGRKCKSAPAVPMLDNLNAGSPVIGSNIRRIHHKNIFIFDGVTCLTQCFPILFDARTLYFIAG